MAGSMERLYELLPRIIHELDEELPVGVLGLDNWGYVTMGPDRNPDSMPSDGWGLFHQSSKPISNRRLRNHITW